MKKYTVDPKTAAYSDSIEITETTGALSPLKTVRFRPSTIPLTAA